MHLLPLVLIAALSARSTPQEPSSDSRTPPVGELPVLKSTRPVVSVKEGDELNADGWHLAPEVSPDVYEAAVTGDGPVTVTFSSDVDQITFAVELGSQHDFVIQYGDERCLTRVVGIRVPPAAVFGPEYRAANAGKIAVEVPEVYELVNVALALTPSGLRDRGLVYHDSDYYRDVLEWFGPHREHPVIAALEEGLGGPGYARLKMNGYAFVFDADDRIVQSPVYDRTSFASERSNSLRPLLTGLQSFADDTSFRAFYAENRATYDEQIEFYRTVADVEGMLRWLDRNFPRSAGYDGVKILFSPLVAYNQSATWIESNGYRELQAHVNYPYPQDVPRRVPGTLSPETVVVLRGDIVFTELNHGYINPEADRYAERILAAISRRDLWVDPTREPGYYPGVSAFDEYMNWALVNLRVVDVVPPAEQAPLIASVERMMTQSRGFPRFAEFDAFLLDLYRERRPEETVADLYPRIIAWFEHENARDR